MPPRASAPAADRLLSIDCLRGLAALAVFIFHVSVLAEFPKRTLPPFALGGRTYDALPSPLGLGASGVNLFFIISGLCLALQQGRAGRSRMDGAALLRYARGRLARIGPAYWITVLVSAALALALGTAERRLLVADVLLHGAFLHWVHPRFFLSLHGGLWSMATEVQFYVAFPLLLSLYSRWGGRRFLLAALLLDLGFRVAVTLAPLPAISAHTSWQSLLSYLLPGRVLEFALGMALSSLYLHGGGGWVRRLRYLFFPTLVAALCCRALGPAYLTDITLGAFYGVLCGLVVLRPPPEAPPRWMEWAARFGRASYSFFLIHYPIMVMVKAAHPFPDEAFYQRFLYLFAVSLPLSGAAGAALYLGVELPLWRRFK